MKKSGACLLGLLSLAACTIKTNTPDGPTETADANAKVTQVVVVGSAVTAKIYVSGDLGLTTLPQDNAGNAILAKDLKVTMKLLTPDPIDVDVSGTECTIPDATKKSIGIGVIIDDSGSMGGSDPNRKRKDATVSFLKTLGTEDKVLLTDYGLADDMLRDLVCVLDTKGNCSPPAATAFTADKAKLIAATEGIEDGGGTPLYEACSAMTGLVGSISDQRRGMLLLSDGQPNTDDAKAQCLEGAKAAQIPVYTVGLGPAAEGDPNADADAVKVLRELATETGGSYASANDPSQLDELFRNVGGALAKGSCRTTAKVRDFSKLQPGATIKGEVTIGDLGAKATFEFVAPQK